MITGHRKFQITIIHTDQIEKFYEFGLRSLPDDEDVVDIPKPLNDVASVFNEALVTQEGLLPLGPGTNWRRMGHNKFPSLRPAPGGNGSYRN